jgi:hypothetical protein
MLTVSRAVVEVNAKFHPAGGRFLVKDYPKDGEYRRLKLTSQMTGKLRPYAHERGLADDDLMFAMPERGPVLKMLPSPDRLGRTGPNAAGRTYRHGTLSAYTAGRCRCEHCKRAFAQYRPQHGRKMTRTPRTQDTDGHIPHWFRNQVWKPALAEAGVTTYAPRPTPYARLVASGGRRPPDRQGAPWPRFDRHDREVPVHAAGHGRLHAARVHQDPRAGGGQQAARSPYLLKAVG